MKNQRKYEVLETNAYKRNYKLMKKRGLIIELLDKAVDILAETGTLPPEYQDHALHGKWKGFRECHIAFDWLLIYKIEKDALILTLTRTGTHTDLLEK